LKRTFKSANSTDGNKRMVGDIWNLLEKNLRIVYGLSKDRHCQERRLTVEDGAPKLITHE
jgi:hypothetical protein